MSKRNRKRKLGSKRDLEERRKDPNAKEKAKALKKQQGSFAAFFKKQEKVRIFFFFLNGKTFHRSETSLTFPGVELRWASIPVVFFSTFFPPFTLKRPSGDT